jgi:hypothetical protein
MVAGTRNQSEEKPQQNQRLLGFCFCLNNLSSAISITWRRKFKSGCSILQPFAGA